MAVSFCYQDLLSDAFQVLMLTFYAFVSQINNMYFSYINN